MRHTHCVHATVRCDTGTSCKSTLCTVSVSNAAASALESKHTRSLHACLHTKSQTSNCVTVACVLTANSPRPIRTTTSESEVFASQSGELVHIETSHDGSTTFHFDSTPAADPEPSPRASGSDAASPFGSKPKRARSRSVRSSSMLVNAPVSAAGFVQGPHPTAHLLPTDVADRVASSYVDRLTHIAPPLPRSPLEDADDEGDWDTDLHTDLPVPGGPSPSGGPRRVDVKSAEALFLLRSFSDLSRLGQLEKAKRLVEEIVQAGRHDVLQRYALKYAGAA